MKAELKVMSTQELTRLEVIQKVLDKRLKQKQAGQMLTVTTRQIRRLVKAYRQEGVDGLISKRRGKASNRQHPKELKKQIMQYVQEHYSDFGPMLASEKLQERHGLGINKETLRQWMMEAEIWKVNPRQSVPIHQQRARRTCLGELIQIDGSPHDWFEGRSGKCCLLVFIDDATGRLMQLRFEETEATQGYFTATRNYIKRHGRPVAFYSDRHGIFRVNIPEAKSGNGETQFGRAMRELDIKIICANSPQAKGRVERMNGTLQDRLVKELRLQNINDIESANAFLPQFIEFYNKRFAVKAANPMDAHRKTLPNDTVLDLIFSHQCVRKLSKNLELSYNNIIYQIKTTSKGYGMRYSTVTVCEDKNNHVTLVYKNKMLDYTVFDKKNQASRVATSKEVNSIVDTHLKIDRRHRGHKPKADHPWRQLDRSPCVRPKESSLQAKSGHL